MKNKGYNQIHFNRQKMLQESTENSMYFKLDYLELLGKHWLLNRAPMLGDWRSSAGATLDWSGGNRWRVASDARKDGAVTGVSFLSTRVSLGWLREDGFRNRETRDTWLDWRGKRCNDAVTGNCWPGLVQPKWAYWLAWASSIIRSPGLLIYKLYI
jgi:hypothetical protein